MTIDYSEINSFGPEFERESTTCPACGVGLGNCTPAPGNSAEGPECGDTSLCCGCGALLQFTGPGGSDITGYREVPDSEISQMSADQLAQLREMREVLARARKGDRS